MEQESQLAQQQISTYQQDGKVDWETVGICAGVGAAVGATSGVAYCVTSLIKSATQVSNALKNVEPNRRTHILQDKHGWSTLGILHQKPLNIH